MVTAIGIRASILSFQRLLVWPFFRVSVTVIIIIIIIIIIQPFL